MCVTFSLRHITYANIFVIITVAWTDTVSVAATSNYTQTPLTYFAM